jgi:hypothetical protein
MRSTFGGRGRSGLPSEITGMVAEATFSPIAVTRNVAFTAESLEVRRTPSVRIAGPSTRAEHDPCITAGISPQHASAGPVVRVQHAWHGKGARLMTIVRIIAIAAVRRMASFYPERVCPAERYEKIDMSPVCGAACFGALYPNAI